MQIEIPDHIAPQVQALISKEVPAAASASREVTNGQSDSKIRALRENWKSLSVPHRGKYVNEVMDRNPKMTQGDLSSLIHVSQSEISKAKRAYQRVYAKELEQTEAAAQVQAAAPAQPVAALLDRTEDLECPAETGDYPAEVDWEALKTAQPVASKQVLPNYIADRVVSPIAHFVAQRDACQGRISSDSVVVGPGDHPPLLDGFAEMFGERSAELPPVGDYDTAYDAYKSWIGWMGEPKAAEPRAPGSLTKTIVINDLHIPFQSNDSIKRMIDTEAHDTDRLVIAGDMADMFNFSHFPKFARSHSPAEEFFEVSKLLQYFNEIFPEVWLFEGNHDDRFMKWLVKDRNVPAEMLEYFNLLAPGFTRPLSLMSKELANIHLVEPVQYENAKFAFLHQFGDFVVAHAETYSKIPNRASTNVAHWVKSFAEPIGLVGAKSKAAVPVRCVGQAHTHQAGMVFGDYATWAFELGCMCELEDYVGNPKIITPRPWVKGYTRVIQDTATGRTDINQSRFVHTGGF